MKNTETITQARQWLKDADAILITASNGLSISEGLNLFSSDKLVEVLGKYQEKYHFRNLLEVFQYPYENQVDKWAIFSRIVECYSNQYSPSAVMKYLKDVISDKPYYAWTSNVDHQLALAGFNNLLEVEGNWQEARYTEGGKQKVISFKEIAHNLVEKDVKGELTQADIDELLAKYPKLNLNMIGEDFSLDEEKVHNFADFVQKYQDQNLVILELGIGPNNRPIKESSMQLVATHPKIHYIIVNLNQLYIPEIIRPQSIGIKGTIINSLRALTGETENNLEVIAPISKTELSKMRSEEEKYLQNFYPNYLVEPSHYQGQISMYMTLDKDTPAHFHLMQEGQSWMYSMGDSVQAYCFTPNGKFYTVRLGLDKTKDEVHGFYVDPGTFVAFESLNNTGAGFAQLSGSLPMNKEIEILTPKVDNLISVFPKQKDIIERLSVKNEEIE